MNDKQDLAMSQLIKIHRLLHREQTQNFSEYGGQGRVLKMLQTQPEISQKDFSQLLGLSKQAAAKLIEKLLNGGYISRELSKDNLRAYSIRLTEKGAAAALRMEENRKDLGLDFLSETELDTLCGLHERIIEHFAELLKIENAEEKENDDDN